MKPFYATLALRAFTFWKIPLIFWLRPSVVEATEDRVEIKIPLGRRSRNHLNAMYFGALASGADLAAGFLAIQAIRESQKKVSFVFKDFNGRFLKRAEDDVHFVCEEARGVKTLIARTLQTGEREELTVPVVALVPKRFGKEPVAEFQLTISVKAKL